MTEIFKALSEESRLRILSLLMDKEMCVCELEVCLKMTQSNASRHLMVLKKSGILESCKKAQWAYFRISDKFKEEHRHLWEYLKIHLKELRTYERDNMEREKYKGIDICSYMNEQR
ncbi:ArsR family transcriptional regulator [Mobilisporobacter senegalensis]|uniref:ArsR family transcriptional regulator n=1 Tax=Mobilisporobacter senegalensis TaxID=1329262 RepID=A0A3N1XR33_9FIRM|nr:metalloregulator ArsR/SmtB family transcription factor [Mobilisporobacter senegalensis]ROR29133.1 ArsR family transcriptional regulator [Mobilisporobacter senegalensis]